MKKDISIELIVDDDVRLLQYTEGDADEIFRLIDRNREHLSQNGDKTASKYPTREAVLMSIKHPKNPLRFRFGIWAGFGIEAEEIALVGSINLTPDDSSRCAEIGYYLGAEYQGNGYMTRSVDRLVSFAFEDISIPEVFAKVNKDNPASRSVLEKTGFSVVPDKSTEGKLYFLKNR